MTYLIIAYAIASLIAAVIIVAACALSSQISQDEGIQERYEVEGEARERRAL